MAKASKNHNLMKKANKSRILNFLKKLQISIERIMKQMSSRIFLKELMRSLSMAIFMMLRKIKYQQTLFNFLDKPEDFLKLYLCSQVMNKNGLKEFLTEKRSNKNLKKSKKREELRSKERRRKQRRKLLKLERNIMNQLNRKKILRLQSYNR